MVSTLIFDIPIVLSDRHILPHHGSWNAQLALLGNQARRYLESLDPFSYDEPLEGRKFALCSSSMRKPGDPFNASSSAVLCTAMSNIKRYHTLGEILVRRGLLLAMIVGSRWRPAYMMLSFSYLPTMELGKTLLYGSIDLHWSRQCYGEDRPDQDDDGDLFPRQLYNYLARERLGPSGKTSSEALSCCIRSVLLLTESNRSKNPWRLLIEWSMTRVRI
jgi:hypothetical protein